MDQNKNDNNSLYLVHHFEGKPLLKAYIENTMMGIEHLWGGTVHLETTEVSEKTPSKWTPSIFMGPPPKDAEKKPEIQMKRVLYTMEKRKLTKKIL